MNAEIDLKYPSSNTILTSSTRNSNTDFFFFPWVEGQRIKISKFINGVRRPAQDINKRLDCLWKPRAGTQITLHSRKNTLLSKMAK